MVVIDSNLSNFSVNVINDMWVLELVPTETQQTMNFLSGFWANIGKKDEIVDTDQPFQSVVLREKKNKKQRPEASNVLKVGVSGRLPC